MPENRPRRLQVLALVHLPPPLHGAAVVSADVVASFLLNERFTIRTIPIQLGDSIERIGALTLSKFVAVGRNVLSTLRALMTIRPDLVYVTLPPHGAGFYAGLPLIAVVKLFRRKILYHFHGRGVHDLARELPHYRLLFRWAVRKADVICLSDRLVPDIVDFVEVGRIHCVPNYTDVEALDHSGSDPHHIIFLSNIVETKGPMILLGALTLLHDQDISFRATFAGATHPPFTAENFAREIARRGLSHKVKYVGPVNATEKRSLLRSAGIFVLPTWNDAFPLTVLEAMAVGLPVVATPEGAIPDAVQHGVTGLIVPHKDVDAVAQALCRLLQDPDAAREMGVLGYDRVKTNFSKNVFFEKIANLWQLVASRVGE